MPNLEFDDLSSDSLFQKGETFLQNNRYQVLSGLIGLLLIGGGLFVVGSNFFEQPKVEILGETTESNTRFSPDTQEKIVVEVSGSVLQPGVYKVPKISRIDDLLVAAGGLSSNADREYVAKNINRAGKLTDGQKIYIPKMGELADYSLQTTAKGKESVVGSQSTVSYLININSASLKDLDSLSGIGSTRAQAIIDNRPYSTIQELVSKKVLPQSVFDKVKDKIVAQ